MSQLGLFAEQLVTETSAAATHWRECLLRWHKAYPRYTLPPGIAGCGRPPSAFGCEGPETYPQYAARIMYWEYEQLLAEWHASKPLDYLP